MRKAAIALHTREQLATSRKAATGESKKEEAKPARVRSPHILLNCMVMGSSCMWYDAIHGWVVRKPPNLLLQPEPTLEGYLRFLQESKIVFDFYEKTIAGSTDPQGDRHPSSASTTSGSELSVFPDRTGNMASYFASKNPPYSVSVKQIVVVGLALSASAVYPPRNSSWVLCTMPLVCQCQLRI